MLGGNKKNQPPTRRMDRNDKALMRTCEWDGENDLNLRLEDRVSLANAKAAFLQGLVVYVGKVHFAEGVWVGVQLTGPSIGRGDCNGIYKGKRYFADVGKNNGIMAPANKVSRRLGMKTGDEKVDEAQRKRVSEEARLADLEFIDALTQTRALAMLKLSEQKEKGAFAGVFNKEETHIARLKQLRMAELLRARGQDPADEALPEPNLKYAPRDAPLQACDLEFAEALESTQQNFCLSDPALPDNPITFASQSFLNMTGYNLNEILGKNCRFLQGDDTDDYAVYRIRLSIKEGSDCHVVLLNYRKDGSPFYNRLFMTALRDTKGRIKNYLGVQCEVSKETAMRINKEEKIKLEAKLKVTRISSTEDMSESHFDNSSNKSLMKKGSAAKSNRRKRTKADRHANGVCGLRKSSSSSNIMDQAAPVASPMKSGSDSKKSTRRRSGDVPSIVSSSTSSSSSPEDTDLATATDFELDEYFKSLGWN